MAVSLRQIIYHTEYSEDQLPSVAYLAAGSNIVPASHCVELTAECMIFEGWYTTSTFDEGTRVIPDVTVIPNGVTPNLYAKWSNANEGESSSVTVASKMTALADEVRELSGATGKLGIDAMTSNLGEANDEVNSQAAQIAEIAELLNGKSVQAGGSSGNEGIETCNVTVTWSKSEDGEDTLYQAAGIPSVAYINGNNELATVAGKGGFPMKANWTATIECMCGSMLVFTQSAYTTGLSYNTSEEIVMSTALPLERESTDVVCVLPNSAGNYTIDVYYN